MTFRASLNKRTVRCYDCGTIFDTEKRECPKCGLRTHISDDYENDDLRKAIAAARSRASAVGSMHALWDTIADAEAILAGKPTLLDYGEDGAAIRHLTKALT